jgi:hypothetical protein
MSFRGLLIFISCFVFCHQQPAQAEDIALFIKESMVNKAISSKKMWEWKDEKQGVDLQLTDLKFSLKDGYIIGTANLHQFEQTGSQKNLSTVDRLIRRASNYKDLAIVQLVTQVGLTPDHKRVILQNTKFTQFDNKLLPGFIEKTFVLSEVNRRFAKEIDGKVIYEFPQNMPIDINRLKTSRQAIEVYGDLIMPCTLN